MSRPKLTVVIAASDSAEAVARTVASIGRQSRVELIVAAARGRIDPPTTSPDVRWVLGEIGVDVPKLRRIGFDQASAPIVAFTEDSCLVDPGWADALSAAFEEDPELVAATGPVEHRPGGSRTDWAVFFCEYAPFLGPDPSGMPRRLAGNNFAVRHARVPSGDAIEESRLVADLAVIGRLASVGSARVWHARRFRLAEAIGDRLRFGFSYGRLVARGRWRAWPIGPAILLVQVARLIATLIQKRRHGGQLLRAGPITLALLTAWSVGEWLGRIAGPRPPAADRRRDTTARPAAPRPGPIESQQPLDKSGPVAA